MFTFFFTEASPFSQWYRCTFTAGTAGTAGGHTFNCAEQYMMHGKALLFGDAEVAAEILAADHPRKHKALGRKVRGFDDARWKREREAIVRAGNHAKFTQNAALREQLLATRGTTLVEASPYDRIWGIGLAASDPRAQDPAKWRGQNLLGRILTALREELLTVPATA
ncbi:MAG TPA: NADAR family protein [Kofleriaceae bacterium]|nr:NADAR family protein [Kofleriaceae bacterium]